MTFADTITGGAYLSWFLPKHLRGSNTLEERRARFLVLYALITATTGPIFAVVFWVAGNPWLALPMGLGALLLFTPPLLLRRGASVTVAGNGFAFLSFATLVLLSWMTGGTQPETLMWLLYPPVVAMIFTGARSGLVWTLISVATCLTFVLLSAMGVQFPELLQSSPTIAIAGVITLISLNSLCFLLYSHLQQFLVRSVRQREAELERAQKKALEASRQSFRTLIENTPDGILILQDEKVVYANPALSRMLGYRDGQLLGRALDQILSDDARTKVRMLAKSLRTMERADDVVEARCHRRDGEMVDVEMRAFSTIFQGVESVIFSLRDITEQKELRAQMAHMDRMAAVGTLAAGVAHEINNPLSFVKSNVEYLLQAQQRGGFAGLPSAVMPELDGSEFGEILDDIHEGAERIRRIVAGLRTYAREDFAKDRTESVNIPELLESILKMAKSEIRHRAQLIVDVPQLPLVKGDASELGQVLLNLIVNAAQAIPPGARDKNHIRISAYQTGRHVCVEVSDTGAGIAEEVQPRIFDPFFSTKAQKPDDQGMGLGLYISQNIVNYHSGELSFESTVGEGTTFRVTLAVADADCDQTPAKSLQIRSTPGSSKEGKLLIVDDEIRLVSSLRRMLSDYEIVVAHSGREAIERLETQADIDVVICDLLMPEMTGMQLFEIMKRDYPDLAQRTLFITGGISTSAARDFVDSTDRPVLDKPLDADELRRIILQCLATDVMNIRIT